MKQSSAGAPGRLTGLDLARGLAVIGMVFVNFMYVFSWEHVAALEANDALIAEQSLFGILTGGVVLLGMAGRAAAIFLTLFGIGLMIQARRSVDLLRDSATLHSLLKRYAILVFGGLAFTLIWDADILHYIGLYGLIAIWMIRLRRRWIGVVLIAILVGGEFLRQIFDYGRGWHPEAIGVEYIDLWSFTGYLRQMFFNGFHPVFPWLAFVVFGLLLGTLDLRSLTIQRRMVVIGITAAIIGGGANLLGVPARFFPADTLFILLGMATAGWLIGVSLYLAERLPGRGWLVSFGNMGRLALTHYVGHVLLGIVPVMVLREERADMLFEVAFLLAIAYLGITLLLGNLWLRRFRQGPLERVLRLGSSKRMNTRKSNLTGASLLVLTLAMSSSASAVDLTYAVSENEQHLGTMELTFRVEETPNGPVDRVDIATNLKVKKLFLTLFSFTSEEVARFGAEGLVNYHAQMELDGDSIRISGILDGDTLHYKRIAHGAQHDQAFPASAYDLTSMDDPEDLLEALGDTLDLRLLDLEQGNIVRTRLVWVRTEDLMFGDESVDCRVIEFRDKFEHGQRWISNDSDLLLLRETGIGNDGAYEVVLTDVQ